MVFKLERKNMSQQEEMKNLSLLGNKETNYIFDYQPEVLESLTIVMWKMIISSNSTVLNLPPFAQSLLSQTLRPFIFPTFLTACWRRVKIPNTLL